MCVVYVKAFWKFFYYKENKKIIKTKYQRLKNKMEKKKEAKKHPLTH